VGGPERGERPAEGDGGVVAAGVAVAGDGDGERLAAGVAGTGEGGVEPRKVGVEPGQLVVGVGEGDAQGEPVALPGPLQPVQPRGVGVGAGLVQDAGSPVARALTSL
jgi:hypothetical protein